MKEEWRVVADYPDYEISSYGRLRMIRQKVKGKNGVSRWVGGKPMEGTWQENTNRYLFYSSRYQKCFKIPRLVCEAFYGPPMPGDVAVHIDGDNRNNKVENLKWGTLAEALKAKR